MGNLEWFNYRVSSALLKWFYGFHGRHLSIDMFFRLVSYLGVKIGLDEHVLQQCIILHNLFVTLYSLCAVYLDTEVF